MQANDHNQLVALSDFELGADKTPFSFSLFSIRINKVVVSEK
jgi:hypothetical protein